MFFLVLLTRDSRSLVVLVRRRGIYRDSGQGKKCLAPNVSTEAHEASLNPAPYSTGVTRGLRDTDCTR